MELQFESVVNIRLFLGGKRVVYLEESVKVSDVLDLLMLVEANKCSLMFFNFCAHQVRNIFFLFFDDTLGLRLCHLCGIFSFSMLGTASAMNSCHVLSTILATPFGRRVSSRGREKETRKK